MFGVLSLSLRHVFWMRRMCMSEFETRTLDVLIVSNYQIFCIFESAVISALDKFASPNLITVILRYFTKQSVFIH